MLYRIRVLFEKAISPICWVCIKLKVSPNAITFIGLLLALGCGYTFAVKQFGYAVILAGAGGILDGVDGKVARDTGTATQWGGFWDSVIDRLSEIAIGVGILASYRGTEYADIAGIAVFVAITASLMTSYVRARAQGLGLDTKGGILQRPDRGLVLAVCALISHKALLVGVGIVAFFGYLTTFQRMYSVWKQTRGT